jgi:hypothetical protein
VILEEIHMYEDQPPFGADEKCKAAYYGPHALGRSVLGTAESITALHSDAAQNTKEDFGLAKPVERRRHSTVIATPRVTVREESQVAFRCGR